MGSTNIQDAKVRISSTKVVDRTGGLKDLIHILKHNRGKPSLEILGNKAYLALCETLFQCMRDERSSYLRSKSKSSKTAALLPLSATALRQIVISGVRTLKGPTVEVIIDHITEILPGKNGTLVKPLLEDLPKALRALLEYQPHVERLSRECWESAIDFCIQSLSSLFMEPDTAVDGSWQSIGLSSSRSRTPIDSVDGPSRPSLRDHSTRAKQIPEELVHTAEDFVTCLQFLTKASNAPVLDKAGQILAAIIEFLQRKIGRGYSPAFATINTVLTRTTLHSTQLTKRTIQELLPLIKFLWSDPLLRDELMITLIHAEPHLSSILASKDEEITSYELEALVDAIYGDYRRRQETSALHYLEDDHLCFRNIGKPHNDSHPLNTCAFSLGTKHLRCEGLWVTVSAIAHFSFLLDERKRMISQDRDDGEEMQIKRLRITHHFQEYLRHVHEPRSNAKRAALQVVAFMVQEGPLDEEDLQQTLEKLTPYIVDENPVHAAWAMIGLAAAAFQECSKHERLLPHWVSAWQSASRVVTSVSSSRAACHLMDVLLRLKIVPFSAVSETMQTMLLTVELSGPALLTDTSSSLLVTAIRERTAENPTHFNQTADRVLYWLLSKWTPGHFPDRTYASLNGQHCNARDILRLLYACLDRPFPSFHASPFMLLGPIAQARVHAFNYQHLLQYLLLLHEKKDFQVHIDESSTTQDSTSSNRRPAQLEVRLLDFCISELEKTKQRWKEWSQSNPQGITSDMMRIVTNFCFVASALGNLAEDGSARVVKLESALDSLTQSFTNFLSRRDIEQYKVDAVLEVCARNLPDVSLLKTLNHATFKEIGVVSVASHMSKALDDRKISKESFYTEDDDYMDIDDSPSSQLAGGTFNPDIDIPRHDLQAQTNPASLRSSCLAYMHLISAVAETPSEEQDNGVPCAFIDYLMSITETDLIHCRQFIKALLFASFGIQASSCKKLLERFVDDLLDPKAREYNTSEVASGMIVEVLISTTPVWSSTSNDTQSRDLYEIVEDLYAYFVKGMEQMGVRQSMNLQKIIAEFLHRLLKHLPNFGQNRRLPSVRTNLFEILDRADIAVKYHITERLPDMFEDFILSEHETIFPDVYSKLPKDDKWREGIAIRLLSLSRLASRWHTLLHRCVYYIFETTGRIDNAVGHAKWCVQAVAKARHLENPQALFKLFAPQIIYSWLDDGNKFAEIPFSAFHYPALVDLLRDIEADAVGQAMMFGQTDELEYLAKLLATTTKEALKRNFVKAAAYSISYDTHNYKRDKSATSSEKQLRDLVGEDIYSPFIYEQYPQVIGIMLQSIADRERRLKDMPPERIEEPMEKRIEKSLHDKPAYRSTVKALKEMTEISHSEFQLPKDIEPSFPAKNFRQQLERLCRRLDRDAVEIWTPSIFTLVMRMLLDRIHPALGPLFACSIIRKIRVLVAWAGDVAFKGYPLQMTLQALQPFLTDIHCAEDTLGIMQYLFRKGNHDLGQHPRFVTGIGLSILISIRVFLGSSQDSTTQESQHTATMNKAQRFHSWFTKYLEVYADSTVDAGSLPDSHIKAFKSITTAASRVREEGNSIRGTEESKLLLELLDDIRSGRNLLNSLSREVALDLLCQNFQPAPTARDDILGFDSDAANYASQVWQSCQRNHIGDGYLLWAARVLGRTFSAFGGVERKSHQSSLWPAQLRSSKNSPGRISRTAIVDKIKSLLYSGNRKEVGLAEAGIRLFISRFAADPYVEEFDKMLPDHIGEALQLAFLNKISSDTSFPRETLDQSAFPQKRKDVTIWIRDLTVSLCHVSSRDPILGSLTPILLGIGGFAEKLFPYILHLVLLQEFDGDRTVRETMSDAYLSWFQDSDPESAPYVRILIEAILYLRSQPTPKEVTRVDRDRWLEVDYLKAAQAATICGMYKSALLFAETCSSQPVINSFGRRTSTFVPPPKLPTDLQFSIYKNLDEPDSFYGVDRGASLTSVLDRFDYEADGVKSLLFRGARMDSQIRRSNAIEPSDSRGMIKSLIMLNMNSITHSLLSNDQYRDVGDDVVGSTLHTARKLGQWDIKAPEGNHTEPSTLFKAFQGLHYATDALNARKQLDRQLLATVKCFSELDKASSPMKVPLRTLAVLTEADELITSTDPHQLLDIWDQMKAREKWMRAGDFSDVQVLLSCRETMFSVLSTNSSLLESLRARTGTVRHMEVEALISSSAMSRRHGALQASLASVTYLSDMVEQCKSVGLNIEATAQHEVASVLWEQGEAETSIRMRQHLINNTDFDSQAADISLPVLLAKLGHHLAEARLAQPEAIIKEYLEPAIQELKGQTQGTDPGQVFHEFALFCDKQLQNPDATEDITRIKTVMDRKYQEAQDFTKLSNTEKSKHMRDGYKRNANRAMTWYNLDKVEYERLRRSREQFLRQCLENYLLSLQASDEFNNDALRVFSLWLEFSDIPLANEAVKLYLSRVPSGKFALLMNQLSSRLQAEKTDFQTLLSELVYRVCVDHPYHGMHQIFAIQMKVGPITREDAMRSKDESAKSRQRAATNIAQLLSNDRRGRTYWNTIFQSNECYHALAMFKNDQDRMGKEIPLDKYQESKTLMKKIPALNVPPATLAIEVRPSCDYNDLPKITGFKPTMSIANGLSAPKVISAKASDGNYYKQLFKSGNDDLRQDAIMEQVFDQVSRLLKNHTATRLRNLGIRTYKVLPLSTRSGLMEFVQDTIPLHSYVMPAHEKYYPRDWKSDKCRREIGNCQGDSQNTRLKVWQKVRDNFHPVLRYFLLERFEDPEEWFEKRLAYTRSTAAISILGHVLGLGDRHCHNILLDEKSGEVVHIDLGVSFEAGRVLPVPEVVPFRLTRDLVDAMGYTKTEGVFRRCCEFTMDTLREERESIMTLLNVLRYDPLVNWSVTPTKAKRMQDNQETNANGNVSRAGTVGPVGTPGPSGAPPVDEIAGESNKKREEQAGEAGRALSVVEKKLSKTLSTRATVNELIQQATDERNLAVLYSGWASYA
ncbi:hypothetical protein K469DRAFT_624615 [Zopfia rhizophila CBS 207.26]|uniref:Serine/threonine-protein kinase Tel1 n=1 Tax=Zopfia rhizophila CBS 207.26 TaxID=1314779 RepID=A0A6A6EEF3_9PEZI|nr:hypothetical protein K469DRAFT_624615 [Zopfia rhizophila CBS 207.26]